MKKKATRASLLPKGLENVNLENTTKALNVATEDRGIDPCSEKRRHITEGRRKSAAEVRIKTGRRRQMSACPSGEQRLYMLHVNFDYIPCFLCLDNR
jgi:hypothetical protein